MGAMYDNESMEIEMKHLSFFKDVCSTMNCDVEPFVTVVHNGH